MGDETAAGGGRAFFLGRIVGARRARGSRVEPLDARWARASGLISAWRSVNVVADASRSMTSLASDDAMSLDPTRATVEVTLLTPTRGSVGGERTLAVDRLERDPTKRERAIRASSGPHAGRRVRLRVARGSPPASFPAPSLGEDARIRARARGASHPGRRAHPPAPHDPPPRRSPARAAARIPPPRRRRRPAPLRGRPRARPPPRTHAIRAPDGRRERHRGIPRPVLPVERDRLSHPRRRVHRRPPLHARPRDLRRRGRRRRRRRARRAHRPTPRASRGSIPRDVGTSPARAKRSRVRSETAGETRLRLARGKRCEELLRDIRLDTRARKDPCASLRIRANARRRDAAAAETLRARLVELRRRILRRAGTGTGTGTGTGFESVIVTRALVEDVWRCVPGIQGARPRPRHPPPRRRPGRPRVALIRR